MRSVETRFVGAKGEETPQAHSKTGFLTPQRFEPPGKRTAQNAMEE
jgi:hypothetical protein